MAGGNVTAVIADPLHAGCVIVSTGLVHMILADGNLQRMCGDQAEILYSRPPTGENPPVPSNKEPIWSAAPDGHGGFWAVGFGLHHFSADGSHVDLKTPAYAEQDGVMLSRAIAGLTLVITDSNRRFQVSGNTPLIIPD